MEASGFGQLDATYQVLSDVLLRLPFLDAPDVGLTIRRATAETGLDFEQRRTPVAAVGLDRQHQTVTVFLAEDVKLDGASVAEALGLGGEVLTRYSGPILPAARGGESVSGDVGGGETGTITCVVEDSAQQPLLLGCNHTLAGVNRAVRRTDTVRQPGAAAGGLSPADTAGPVRDFEQLQLGGVTANVMDAAVSDLRDATQAHPGVVGIGPIAGIGAAAHGDAVEKVGWSTGHTKGTYQYDMRYTTAFGNTPALFEGQMGIVGSGQPGSFAQQGDSGAPVLLPGSSELVGMVVGVANGLDLTFVSPIVPVLSRFGVTPMP
ncbi:hypothetical protein VSS74_05405 [Conexibacter stalactiti]|uniref:Peptidase S1 domain-containing protein n=1 Tax=Conexibacter stalactiti TaxID=1940611 RepID=A0ABU4HM11_9ACTN|nr:hypothetical protein [Conexibacter stalactiti]MDW5593759.1 hypothetical protein [Conexibacter stalactiti]MEC5034401.1 hypothetical protein [Conexibacter stalactiti]